MTAHPHFLRIRTEHGWRASNFLVEPRGRWLGLELAGLSDGIVQLPAGVIVAIGLNAFFYFAGVDVKG